MPALIKDEKLKTHLMAEEMFHTLPDPIFDDFCYTKINTDN